MYLARRRIKSKTHYYIRQSYAGPGCIQSRDLLNLGTDPTRFIVYPGGNSYYFDPCIEESLRQQGLEVNQNDLDAIFFEFLRPETKRLIAGFDRSFKRRQVPSSSNSDPAAHIFDKRRFHYLRFGRREKQYIKKVPEKVFQPLLNKSRDEIEQYFLTAEKILNPGESVNYITIIFELKHFTPDPHTGMPLIAQLDTYFIDRLCRINNDPDYTAGIPGFQGLYEYLVKYAIMYFDSQVHNDPWRHDYIRDFINRHRVYTPPPKIQIKIREAEHLFEHSWKELQRMDRSTLTRKYRQMALKHHPDHGGRSEIFQRLTTYYRALLAKK